MSFRRNWKSIVTVLIVFYQLISCKLFNIHHIQFHNINIEY